MKDRFGLLWRPEHAADLLGRLDRIDALEVIADDWYGRPRRELRALRTLAREVPLRLHGIGLGLASTERVHRKRLDALARVVGEVEPEAWSEHLAFVRGGGVEIGHLAAPPRRPETVDGAVRNVREAARVVGSLPLLENVATLLDPPASTLCEAEWTRRILDATGAALLLDLHNLHANRANFGGTLEVFLTTVGLERVREVHIAGGRRIGRTGAERILDDHRHDVPAPVFDDLTALGAHGAAPLVVVLERDGNWPGAIALLRELNHARATLAAGRAGVLAGAVP